MSGRRSLIGLLFLFILLLPLGLAPSIQAGDHGKQKPVKKGILLVSFGTSIPKAQQVFDKIDAAAKDRFKDVEIRWAFTAKMIRRKLAKEGKVTLSPSQALANMAEDGFTHVAVQSLHVIPGQEFHQMQTTVKRFQGMPKGIVKVLVGRPLLATTEDLLRTAEAVVANLPQERKKGEAVILMGHGTHHPGNVYYPAMNFIFQKMDPDILVGTVEGYPELDQIKEELAKKKIKKVWLMPFMSVAGDHAMNDMAGDEEDSWKSVLTKAGIQCEVVLTGMAAYPQIVEIWLDHLASAFNHFK
jgi:sirohydrochlorin cobaltochelatase